MNLFFSTITLVLLLSSCNKDDNAVLGKWKTDLLTIKSASQNNVCQATLTVARSIDNEYIIVMEHEGEILTFASTSESDGTIYIISLDDELSWDYGGEISIVDEELHLTYGYDNITGSEIPPFSSDGIFTKN